MAKSCYLSLQNAPSNMLDRVLNTPPSLDLRHVTLHLIFIYFDPKCESHYHSYDLDISLIYKW